MTAVVKVVAIPRIVEAVRWLPDESGKLPGGWPQSRKWAAARHWTVSAIDLSLYVSNYGMLTGAPSGHWVLLHEGGLFTVSSPEAFLRDYKVLPDVP